MESVEISGELEESDRKDWALYGDRESRGNLITSIYMSPSEMEAHNQLLQDQYAKVEREVVDFSETDTDDASLIFVTYGIVSRICHGAVKRLRELGLKVGMLRLKTLFPLPEGEVEGTGEEERQPSLQSN